MSRACLCYTVCGASVSAWSVHRSVIIKPYSWNFAIMKTAVFGTRYNCSFWFFFFLQGWSIYVSLCVQVPVCMKLHIPFCIYSRGKKICFVILPSSPAGSFPSSPHFCVGLIMLSVEQVPLAEKLLANRLNWGNNTSFNLLKLKHTMEIVNRNIFKPKTTYYNSVYLYSPLNHSNVKDCVYNIDKI